MSENKKRDIKRISDITQLNASFNSIECFNSTRYSTLKTPLAIPLFHCAIFVEADDTYKTTIEFHGAMDLDSMLDVIDHLKGCLDDMKLKQHD